MDIRFISSLTREEEDRLAQALMDVARLLLEPFSIAYTLRIQTSESKVLHHRQLASDSPPEPTGREFHTSP